jgi:DNA-directed RNA polymerase subunit K/omega
MPLKEKDLGVISKNDDNRSEDGKSVASEDSKLEDKEEDDDVEENDDDNDNDNDDDDDDDEYDDDEEGDDIDIDIDLNETHNIDIHNDSDDESENEGFEDDLQKIQNYSMIKTLESMHPEINQINPDELMALSKVVRNIRGEIIDPLHTTIPIITKYEKARIIGSRAEQINRGAPPTVHIEPDVIDGRVIAIIEFEQKQIPFIIARPMPSGGVEYWKISDLEDLN